MTTTATRAFEDFREGELIPLHPYRVSEEQILAFARQYDPQPFHTDPEAAKASIFGGLVASGWMTTAVFMRMQYDGFIRDSTCLGSPGVDEIRWLLPVRPGDELRGECRVTAVRPSRSKPDRGAVFADCEVRNQDGEVVMTLRTRALFRRREGAAGGA